MCGLASSSTRLTHHTGAETAQSPHDPPAKAASLPLEVPKEQTVSQDRKRHLQQAGLGSPQPVHTVCTVRAAWYEHTEYCLLLSWCISHLRYVALEHRELVKDVVTGLSTPHASC